MDAGDRIRNARKKAGLTQSELGEKLGVPFQSISQWERGKRHPKFETMVSLAYALDVDIDYLLGTEDVESLKEDRAMQNELKAMSKDDLDLLCLRYNLNYEAVVDAIEKDGSNDSNARMTRAKLYTLYKIFLGTVPTKPEWKRKHEPPKTENNVDDLGSQEMRLIRAFVMLNDEGRRIAIGRLEELTEIPKYRDVPKT